MFHGNQLTPIARQLKEYWKAVIVRKDCDFCT